MTRGLVRCVECSRVFDLFDPIDSEEWAFGHDCEPVATCPECRRPMSGASFSGRCYRCHVAAMPPADSGREYQALGGY